MNHSIHKKNYHSQLAQQETKSSSSWMVTFSDLLSIIITFFVLIYSMSSIEDEEWNEVSHSFAQSLNPSHLLDTSNTPQIIQKELTPLIKHRAEDIEYIKLLLQDHLNRSPALHDILSLNVKDGQLFINLHATDIFREGDIILTKKGGYLISIISNILRSITNEVTIYAYANDFPNITQKYPTSWELSLARGLVVSQILRKKGYEYMITTFARANFSRTQAIQTHKLSNESLQYIEIVIQQDEAEQ